MANTTFQGTVRAESGLKVATKSSTTGAYTDYFTVSSAGAVSASSTLSSAGATSLATTALMTVGTGISAVSAAIVKHSVVLIGNIYETTIALDLTGLSSSAAADIIGKEATANCHYGQITAAVNGTILSGYMQCLETPGTGEPDIDLYSANEATGTEDAAVTGLTETALLATAVDWTGILAPKGITTVPPANDYLYLVGSGGGTDAVYDAGKFILKFYGYSA
jgi:hypothetical protein|tara:strand:+ start:152 stop:817 length:666 start_codon:yes stop_codon:yes gene_type:complete